MSLPGSARPKCLGIHVCIHHTTQKGSYDCHIDMPCCCVKQQAKSFLFSHCCVTSPPAQARVNPRTQSPIVATIITGTIIGVLAFFVPLEVLADLVSMGTLFAFAIVDLSVAVRARYQSGKGIPKWRLIVPCGLVVIGSCMIGFSYSYKAHWAIIVAGAGVFIVGTLLFYTLPVVYRPEGFAVPLNPILPCLGTLANIFLIGERGAAHVQGHLNLQCAHCMHARVHISVCAQWRVCVIERE